MKLLLDIQSDKLSPIMDFLKTLTDVRIEKITDNEADLLTEIKEIKKAFKHSEMIDSGKLNTKPVSELLDGL